MSPLHGLSNITHFSIPGRKVGVWNVYKEAVSVSFCNSSGPSYDFLPKPSQKIANRGIFPEAASRLGLSTQNTIFRVLEAISAGSFLSVSHLIIHL